MKEEREDLFRRTEAFEATLAGSSTEDLIHDLAVSGRTNRRYIRMLAVAFVAIALLLMAIGGLGLFTMHVSHRAEVAARDAKRAAAAAASLQTVLYQNCLLSNDFLIRDYKRWVNVIGASREGPQPSLTPAQKKQRDAVTKRFYEDLVKTDAPRDCSKIRGVPTERGKP